MGSKARYFRYQILIRTFLIVLSALAALYLALAGESLLTALIIGAAVLIQGVLLTSYILRETEKLKQFLQIIRYSDFSLSCKLDYLGPEFRDLQEEFGAIIMQFMKQRSEKEQQSQYLQTIIHNVATGIISFDASGAVDLCNKAAKRQLRLPHLRHLDSFPEHLRPLAEAMRSMAIGEKRLVRMNHEGEVIHLALYKQQFKAAAGTLSVITLQNIREELEEQESAAWLSLIRVLTHEMMNSMTPIASLSDSATGLLGDEPDTPPSRETLDDLRRAMKTISLRSHGLMQFIQAYRNMTLIPTPRFVIIPVADLLRRVENLFQSGSFHLKPRLEWQVDPESLDLTADPELIEQVLINLVKNAGEALEGRTDGLISIQARLNDQGRVLIQVTDNGPGIPPDQLDKIFIPFFSTKKQGSGIGLSFSRQVMRLHHGSITVQSEPGQTRFLLRF